MMLQMRSQQRCGRFAFDFFYRLRYNYTMVENPFESTTEATTTPASEQVAAPQPFLEEEKSLIEPEKQPTETELEDKEKLEQAENQFDELDEELTDLEDTTDTVWLLRRVGFGILKTLLVLGGLGIVGWLIWGGSDKLDVKKALQEKPIAIESVKTKIFPTKDALSEKLQRAGKKKEKIVQNSSTEKATVAQKSMAGRSLGVWNYWIETQRLSDQKGLLAEVLLWKREVESVFEVPFPEQITGETAILRDYQVGRLLQMIARLISRSDVLQARLSQDITEFTRLAATARNASLESETLFLDALKTSNPEDISLLLDRKIEAEKDLQKFSVDAEARRIFAQKTSEYVLVLENIQTVLIANRAAIAQDIQVVNFPEDPFGRVISPSAWTTQ